MQKLSTNQLHLKPPELHRDADYGHMPALGVIPPGALQPNKHASDVRPDAENLDVSLK